MPRLEHRKYDLPQHTRDMAERLDTREAPVVARALIERDFNALFEALDEAGIGHFCRNGFIDAVRQALKNKATQPKRQYDLFALHPALLPAFNGLTHGSYYVEDRREEVPVIELVDNLDQFREAEAYMYAMASANQHEAEMMTAAREAVEALKDQGIDPLVRRT
jgi:hypothetical protein